MYDLGESQQYREYLDGSQGKGLRHTWSDIDMLSLIRYYVYTLTLYTYIYSVFAFVQKKSGGYCRLIQIDDGNVSEHCFSRLLFYLQK